MDRTFQPWSLSRNREGWIDELLFSNPRMQIAEKMDNPLELAVSLNLLVLSSLPNYSLLEAVSNGAGFTAT